MRTTTIHDLKALPFASVTLREPTMRELLDNRAIPDDLHQTRGLALLSLCMQPSLSPDDMLDLPLSGFETIRRMQDALAALMRPETEPDPDAKVEEGADRPPG